MSLKIRDIVRLPVQSSVADSWIEFQYWGGDNFAFLRSNLLDLVFDPYVLQVDAEVEQISERRWRWQDVELTLPGGGFLKAPSVARLAEALKHVTLESRFNGTTLPDPAY